MANPCPLQISHEANSLAQVEDLVAYLHTVRERERVALARKLHDELGGLLVAAVMDLGWAEQHLCSEIGTIGARLRRVRTTLGSAIDLKRAMTEALRPTLLENFGLFAACRWHFKHVRIHPAVTRTEHYPDYELAVTDEALTSLFRIVQDLLDMTSREPEIRSIDLSIDSTDSALVISLDHQHTESETVDVVQAYGAELASVSHRVKSLHGHFTCAHRAQGARYKVTAPLREILACT